MAGPEHEPRVDSRFLAIILAVFFIAASCSSTSGPASTTTAPPPVFPAENRGADGLGDPPFPTLGNGGYDAEHYTLDLDYDPAGSALSASAQMLAVTTQVLSSFSLDLRGLTVSKVAVNGIPAEFLTEERKLHVVPEGPIPEGSRFTVTVDYEGVLLPKTSVASRDPVGWFPYKGDDGSGAYTNNGVDGASAWFPANDHPSDKATFDIRLTAPKGLTVAANGMPVPVSAPGATRRWVIDVPMAGHLVAVFLGSARIVERAGVPQIRDTVPEEGADEIEANLATTPQMIAWFAGMLGPFPFADFGDSVLPPAAPFLGSASPGQTRSVLDNASGSSQRLLAQLVASQWLGASVGLASWEDVWWTRGWATYAGWLWDAQLSENPAFKFDRTVAAAYEQLESTPSSVVIGQPTAAQFEAPEIATRGALTYHVLRATVGDALFWAGLRTFAERFRFGVATPAELIRTMEEVSGVPLQPLVSSWVYSAPLPPQPAAIPAS